MLGPEQWFAAVLQEAGEGASFQWPARVEPEFAAADQVAFGTVPGIARLRPVQVAALGASVWLLPALTSLLAFAFALAFVQQRRAVLTLAVQPHDGHRRAAAPPAIERPLHTLRVDGAGVASKNTPVVAYHPQPHRPFPQRTQCHYGGHRRE